MKICLKCHKSKESFDFNKDRGRPDGRFPYCRECVKQSQKIRYKENKFNILNEQKIYYKKNRSLILERNKAYGDKNKKKKQKYDKNYNKANKEARKIASKKYRLENKDKIAESNRLYRATQNKQLVRAYHSNYMKNRRNYDPLFKFSCNLRNRINKIFLNKSKPNKTFEMLGCSIEFAKRYLENQFQDGMTWDNYGKWHVDHKIALCTAKTTEELEKLCHYTNLQPLWAIDNLRKNKR